MTLLRWLSDPPADGVTNMARDEALLQRVDRGKSPPTLRFYRWSQATLSLGYFQKYADFAALPPPIGNLPVVRRQTGGGAILHDLELTYSLSVPLNHPLITDDNPNTLYQRVHSAFAELLTEYGVPVEPQRSASGSKACSQRGPFYCFERHTCLDLLIDGKKLMGSAQRRTPKAVLQHGSLILDSRFEQQQCATVAKYAEIDIDSCLAQIVQTITDGHVEEVSSLDPVELELAEQLRDKYADPAWTQKR